MSVVTRFQDIPTEGNIELAAPAGLGSLNVGEQRIIAQECKMPFQAVAVHAQRLFESVNDDDGEGGGIDAAMADGTFDMADLQFAMGRIALRRLAFAADVPMNAERVVLVADPTPAP